MIRVLPVVNEPVINAIDGFGSRTTGIDSDTGDEVELLDLAPELVEHAGFVTALGERVARFAAVTHTSYVHLRRLDRPSSDRLQLVSDYTPGWRLSDLLAESTAAGLSVDITVVIGLMRQLLPAVALYGRHNREAAIGALAPERLIVTPQARLVIAEHAFGPPLEKLNMGRDRLWRELRVAMPPSAGLPRANQRSDANAMGVVALSLLLGRVLTEDEYPSQLQSLVKDANEHRDGEASPLSSSFSSWMARALQFDVRTAFQSPSDAQLAFETVLASDRSYVTSPAKLEEWVSNIGGRLDERRRPKPDPEVLRQQELEKQREIERQQEEERQRELERQQAEQREREREEELARLRDLERQRAEELEQLREQERQLREQERQRALEVETLREQEREREEARERERELERQREEARQQELERERQRARVAEEAAAEAAAAAAIAAYEPPAAAREESADAPVFTAPVSYETAEPIATAAPATPEAPEAPEAPQALQAPKAPVLAMAGVILLLLLTVGWLMTRGSGDALGKGEGELVVQSRPPGARVVVDGKEMGQTPVTLRLEQGAHVLEVQIGKGEPRVIPLVIRAGVQSSQYIELQEPKPLSPPPAPAEKTRKR